MLVDDRLKGMSKTDAEKLKESISKHLSNAQKGDRDYVQHIEDVLTDSAKSIPAYTDPGHSKEMMKAKANKK